VLFDYRLKHRGDNHDTPRPVLYFTYSKPCAKSRWKDDANFNKKRCGKLVLREFGYI
jgi:hypothetical protein